MKNPKTSRLRYLWYFLTVPLIAVLVVGITSAWGQSSQSKQLQQLQQGASRTTCSDTIVGGTEVAPSGTQQHLFGSNITTNGLEVAVQNISYTSSGIVNVKFKVTNKSTTLSSSELYTNTGVIGSDGNYYYACLAGSVGCPYNVNSLTVDLGQINTTCVTYLLPINVTVSEVEYVPSPDSNDNYVSNPILWLVAPSLKMTVSTEAY